MLAGASSNPGTGTESNPRILKKRHIDTEAAFLSTIDLENGKWRIETDEIKFVEKLGTGASGPVFRGTTTRILHLLSCLALWTCWPSTPLP